MRHGERKNMRLIGVLVRIAGPVHHPAPRGFEPCHARGRERRRGVEALMSDGGDGDGGGIGLVEGYGIRVVESADLAVRHGGFAGLRFAHFAECSRSFHYQVKVLFPLSGLPCLESGNDPDPITEEYLLPKRR